MAHQMDTNTLKDAVVKKKTSELTLRRSESRVKRHATFLKKNPKNAEFIIPVEAVEKQVKKKRRVHDNILSSIKELDASIAATEFTYNQIQGDLYAKNSLAPFALFSAMAAITNEDGVACTTPGCSGMGKQLSCSARRDHTLCYKCWCVSTTGKAIVATGMHGSPPCVCCPSAFFDLGDVIRAAPWGVGQRLGMESARREQPGAKPECGICGNPYNDGSTRPVASTRCGHVFCDGCTQEWSQRQAIQSCPKCRAQPFGPFISIHM